MKTIKIGRNADNDLVINDETRTVSGYHAVMKVYDNGTITICDSSTNGTYINGIKATKDIDVSVRRGDKILLGPYVLLDWSVIPVPTAQQTTPLNIQPAPNYKPKQQVNTATKEMFSHPYSFDGRIRRSELWISTIIYTVIALIINAIGKDGGSLGTVYLAYIPLLWFIAAQNAKRCHDRGNSGWYQLIPFYGLWLLFGDSDPGNNMYGNNPKGIN